MIVLNLYCLCASGCTIFVELMVEMDSAKKILAHAPSREFGRARSDLIGQFW